jgi:hypothetical protein
MWATGPPVEMLQAHRSARPLPDLPTGPLTPSPFFPSLDSRILIEGVGKEAQPVLLTESPPLMESRRWVQCKGRTGLGPAVTAVPLRYRRRLRGVARCSTRTALQLPHSCTLAVCAGAFLDFR